MPSYKLYYFNARGRAEVARLLFAASGTKYEDVRLQGEEWAKFKPDTPFGQLPVLEVDGKKIGQSIAIYNYLAREFGFYGKNNAENTAVDQIVQNVSDLLSETVKFMMEKDEAKKAELAKNFQENVLPKFLGIFSKVLKENGSGYFAGKGLTLADFVVYDTLSSLEMRTPGALDNNADLKSFVNKIGEIPKIKKYVAERPQTNF